MNSLESTLDQDSSTESDPDKSKKKSRKIASKVLTKEVDAKPKSYFGETASKEKKITLPWDRQPEAELKLFRAGKKDDAVKEKYKESVAEELITEAETPEVESRLLKHIKQERRESGDGVGQGIESDALNDFETQVIEKGLASDIVYKDVMKNLGLSEDEIEQIQPDTFLENMSQDVEVPIAKQTDSQNGTHELIHEDEVLLNSNTISSNTTGSSGGGASNSAGSTPNWAPSSAAGGGKGGGGRGTLPTAFGGMWGPNNNGPNFGPNINPSDFTATAANPNATANTPNLYRDQNHPATTAVLGGIIGYLIGRRRGRIKTEKQLLPMQKKLEKQVEDINWQLKAKESKIREAAREKAYNNKMLHYERSKLKNYTQENIGSRDVVSVQEKEVNGVRQKAPEANQLHGTQNVGERIGHVVIASESAHKTSSKGPERSKLSEPTKKEVLEHLSQKRIETLSRPDLMKISEKIIVGGSSLRQVYETHLIGEKGLRRLVNEHFNGGDLQKALRKEIVEKEIDFERDPALRDMALSSTRSGSSSVLEPEDNISAFNKLMQKAEASIPTSASEMLVARTKEGTSAHVIHKHAVIDKLLTAIIIILVAVVTLIYFANR